jgi:hypothetical protein
VMILLQRAGHQPNCTSRPPRCPGSQSVHRAFPCPSPQARRVKHRRTADPLEMSSLDAFVIPPCTFLLGCPLPSGVKLHQLLLT